jgi:hypothetical protein
VNQFGKSILLGAAAHKNTTTKANKAHTNNFLLLLLMYFSSFALISAIFLSSSSPTMVSASHGDCHDPSTVNVVTAKATEPAKASAAFEAFRELLGGVNHGGDGDSTFDDGHRQINWDAGALPFVMPGPFFSNPVSRGLICSNSDGEFVVSNPPDGSDDKFDSIDPALSADLQTFSDFRLFSALNDKVIDITFVVPSNINLPAAVTGFGAIFVDVDLEGEDGIL